MARDHAAITGAGARALVVLGAPRSGTTLIATVLGAHPAVGMLFEDFSGGLFRIVGGKLPAVKLCTPNEVDLDRHWRGAYAPIERNGWLRKHIGYRLPRSRLSLRDMSARAELKILCLLRDPAANFTAIRTREGRSDAIACDMLRRTYALYRRLPDEPRMDARIVSFDRFVRAPEEQIRKLCEWIGLAYDPIMLDAPRLNPVYPESGFRADKASDGGAAHAGVTFAALQTEYRALLAQAQ